MTHAEALLIVSRLAERTATAWTPEKLQAFATDLEDLDRDRTAAAVLAMIRTRTSADFTPTIGDIRRTVAHDYATEHALGWLDPDEAWSIVNAAFNRCGDRKPFPPLIEHVVNAIGWQQMGMSENLDVLRGQFRAMYTIALERAVTSAAATDGALPALPAPDRRRLESKLRLLPLP